MASAVETITGLRWVSVDGGGENLVAVHLLSFDVFEGYIFETSGSYQAGRIMSARGVVIDNLDSATFVNAETASVFDRVPPFTRQTIALPARSTRLSLTAGVSKVRVTFFTGQFPAALSGANFYGAFKQAIEKG